MTKQYYTSEELLNMKVAVPAFEQRYLNFCKEARDYFFPLLKQQRERLNLEGQELLDEIVKVNEMNGGVGMPATPEDYSPDLLIHLFHHFAELLLKQNTSK